MMQHVCFTDVMNNGHRRLCSSARWGRHIRVDLVPWVVGERALGGSVLEIGPGPGLTTDVLRSRTRRITAVEADDKAATRLQRRLTGANVTVVHADAVAMPFRSGRFTAAAAMTMLHHVPTVAAQDALLAEARRVLRPGAWLLGVDSLDSPGFRAFHTGDVCVPIDPATFGSRLSDAGFVDVEVELGDGAVRFAGRVPTAGPPIEEGA
jgi:SAM-dependent methyltransferase